MTPERVELADGLDWPALLARAEAGACVVLTRDARDVVALVAPASMVDAGVALLLEALEPGVADAMAALVRSTPLPPGSGGRNKP